MKNFIGKYYLNSSRHLICNLSVYLPKEGWNFRLLYLLPFVWCFIWYNGNKLSQSSTTVRTQHALKTKSLFICDTLYDLVPFVQFKKHEKHSWRSNTFTKIAGFSLQLYKKYYSSMVVSTFFKLYKWYQIAQSVS